MKLKYIIGVVLSALILTGCSEDQTLGSLGSISLDKTYVSIPEGGGDVTVKVTANQDWRLADVFVVSEKDADGNKITANYPLPTWLIANQVSGSAGTTELILHADATSGGREAELQIAVGDHTQFLMVRQGSMEASSATCAEVIAGPDSKTYRVTGTVTSIANTTYGNWYLEDATGQVYIYGTLDKNGAAKNFLSLGIEVGDVVTVEGPKTTYNGTVELVDVTVIKIVKSLIKVVTAEEALPAAGGKFEVKVAYKGNGAYLTIPEEAKEWIQYEDTKYIAGEVTTSEANPADTAVFRLSAAPNKGATRKAALELKSYDGKKNSAVTYNVTQEGVANPPKGTGTKSDPYNVAAALEYTKGLGADVTSENDVYVKGKISSIKYSYSAQYGTATYNISDDGQEDNVFVVYSSLFFNNEQWKEGQSQINVGDEVIVCGKVIYYGGTTPEFASKKSWLISLNGKTSEGGGSSTQGADGSTIVTIADFNAAPESTDVWYQLTGKVKNLKDNDQYGNFDLEDATGSVYVYGVLSEKGGAKKQFQTLAAEKGIKEGSTLTIVGNRGSYNGKIEVLNAYFISCSN